MSIVKITVNGKEYSANTEKTLLDNILDNGIYLFVAFIFTGGTKWEQY